jgi:molybdate transport system ATP-binding protein
MTTAHTLLELAFIKRLNTFTLEVELHLEAHEGQILVLFGPSGSGKSMTLKCIAGVTDPTIGFISIAGQVVFDSHTQRNLALRQRQVGYLPQNYALFPHLNVTENIAFGLFNWPKSQARQRVSELCSLMQLEGLEKRLPRELSGGQQQRVAFARALAPKPSILLLDEPFSALDATIRTELRQNIALLSRKLNMPVVFITHDLEEAYMLADKIAVYQQGHILQYADREEVFYRPATLAVAQLLGLHNLWSGQVSSVQTESRLVSVQTGLGEIWAEMPAHVVLPTLAAKVVVCVRPEHIKLTPLSDTSLPQRNCLEGQLIQEIARGSFYTLLLRLNALDQFIELELPAQQFLALKQQSANWRLTIEPNLIHLIIPT